MIHFLKDIVELVQLIGEIPRHWRGFLGSLFTGFVVLGILSIAPAPWSYVSGGIVALLGFYMSCRWDVRARRRGKIPPAGGWR